MATLLEEVALGVESTGRVLDVVVAAERLVAWAQSRQASAIAELTRRPELTPSTSSAEARGGVPEVLDPVDLTAMEISAALRISPSVASTRVVVSCTLIDLLPGTQAALRGGELDWARARVIVDAVRPLAIDAAARAGVEAAAAGADAAGQRAAEQAAAWAVAQALEARVLDRAPRQTRTLLRRSVARAVVGIDPGAAERRRVRAVKGRRASFTPQPDGMAEIGALLPAAEAVEVWNVLDRDARAARAAGDPRTLDQLRADALVQRIVAPTSCTSCTGHAAGSSSATGAGGVPGSGGSSAGAVTRLGRARRGAEVQVTVPASTLLGADDEPADLTGYGPITPALARAIAADTTGTWRRLVTDPVDGTLIDRGRRSYVPSMALADHVRTRHPTRTAPGCGANAATCDLRPATSSSPTHGAAPPRTTCDPCADATTG